ncbi:MAG: glycosyltransferase [Luteococcus japonicus]
MSEPQSSSRNIAFHTPYPLNRKATAASGIRPVKMREAFEELGYTVWEVTGRARERRAAARRVRAAMKAGTRFEFCYSEASTMPTTMTEPHHLPLHPLLDVLFLRDLHRAGTKVGLFYRDCYWAFEGYGDGLNPVKKHAALAAYRFDLLGYRDSLDVLYTGSVKMGPWIKVGNRITKKELPSGHVMPTVSEPPTTGVRLFYVGGLGHHYRLPLLFEAVKTLSEQGVDVTLTACASKQQWEEEKDAYLPFLCDAITVVHESGEALNARYAACNIASLFVEPSSYREIAMPMKLFEYIGQGRPVLASVPTASGHTVAEQGLGWAIPYTLEDVTSTLRRLAENPDEIMAMHGQVMAKREQHTWLARARQVAEDLR